MTAGELHNRFAFDARVEQQDGRGNTVASWLERFQCRAGVLNMRGGETVMAARLEGRRPVVVTVRNFPATRQVTTDWRCRDVRTGEAFNVRAVQPSQDRAYIEFLCESGVANG